MIQTPNTTKLLCCIFAACCLSSIGCIDRLSEADRQILNKADQAYKSHDDREVIRLTDEIIARNQRMRNMEPWRLRGMAKFRLADLNGAEADLAHAIQRTSDEALKRDALATLGEIAYRKGDMSSAADKLYAAVGDENWRGLDDAQVSFKLGCALQWLGKWEDADLYFQRIDYLFPDSDLASQSRKLVNARAWTIVLGRFADKPSAEKAKASMPAASDAAIEPILAGDKLEFVLAKGRYQTHDQANAASAKLAAAEIKVEISVIR